MKTLDDVIAHFGNRARLAEALGIEHQAISQWKNGIPPLRAYEIEKITKGKFTVRNLPVRPK